MRNLLEYPVTYDEIIDELQEILDEWEKYIRDDPPIGSMRGVLLQEAIEAIHRLKDLEV